MYQVPTRCRFLERPLTANERESFHDGPFIHDGRRSRVRSMMSQFIEHQSDVMQLREITRREKSPDHHEVLTFTDMMLLLDGTAQGDAFSNVLHSALLRLYNGGDPNTQPRNIPHVSTYLSKWHIGDLGETLEMADWESMWNAFVVDGLPPWVLSNESRDILFAAENGVESFEAMVAYRDLMGKQKASDDSGWKSARLYEWTNYHQMVRLRVTREPVHSIESLREKLMTAAVRVG